MPRLHARSAPPRVPQRARRADRGPLGADDRRHAVGRVLHGHGRLRGGGDLLGPGGRRLARMPPSATTGRGSSSPTSASTSTTRTGSSYTCSSSSTRAPPRRRRRCSEEAARGELAITSLAEESRPPASTGRTRTEKARRPAVQPSPAADRGAAARAPREQRQRHRDCRRQLIDDEEEQIEHAGEHERREGSRPLRVLRSAE